MRKWRKGYPVRTEVERESVREELRQAYRSASEHQRIAMLATQKAALEICEDWINFVLTDHPRLFNTSMRVFMLRLSDVIESTPMDYGR